ncbi:hypothetical protein SPSIL_001980 [Sporomusa silvacetica DSM 10669]|uniref:PepSY-associated TM helix n=1 Tax=Sporomusa silvacetica DSM 10669 TaxID=1123289 RepID=A0ABZ3IFI5_9FIRM|nr:PepSY domain-containing protein [Sporomusa silvacetica]OZC17900.1 hypothetical protein SPSIL_30400 [Sporomusa silvacetica DSM 10669]
MIIYQTARKLHLYLGLILVIVLLSEAITGLILAEPGLVGQEKPPMPAVRQSSKLAQEIAPESKGLTSQSQDQLQSNTKPVASGIFGITRGLHQEKIGNLDLKWIVDLAAIGLILLTLTGKYLLFPALRSRRKNR